eukprot:15276178-Alexandrium_andersonii.AAC.1
MLQRQGGRAHLQTERLPRGELFAARAYRNTASRCLLRSKGSGSESVALPPCAAACASQKLHVLRRSNAPRKKPVSYTHLTLPTICSV